MKKIALSILATVIVVCGLITTSSAYADVICSDGSKKSELSSCPEWNNKTGISQNGDLMESLNTVINVIVGVVGFISVVMIVLGGISFATSQGDTAKTTKARNTILYGVVGLVVALLAFAIVNFVLKNVFGGGN